MTRPSRPLFRHEGPHRLLEVVAGVALGDEVVGEFRRISTRSFESPDQLLCGLQGERSVVGQGRRSLADELVELLCGDDTGCDTEAERLISVQ